MPQDFEDRSDTWNRRSPSAAGGESVSLTPNAEKIDILSAWSKQTPRSHSNSVSVFLKPDSEKILGELQELLELSHFPQRIESFDISNISGSENVAGIVVFENGKPARGEYRRFIIKVV